MEMPKRLVLIGLDAAIPTFIWKLAEEGELPTMANLIERGVFAANCLPPYPTLTPSNWTTIATGAWPSTHGITCFWVHHPGESLDKLHSGFNCAECSAEHLWDTAEKVGKKCILLKYDVSWPPTMKKGIQVDGCHLDMCIHQIDGPHLFTVSRSWRSRQQVVADPSATLIQLRPASEWVGIPESPSPYLESDIIFKNHEAKPKSFHLLVMDSQGGGYDKVILSRSKNVDDKIADMSRGQWSEWILEQFETEEGVRKGNLRFKLIELSSDAKRLRLYSTQVFPLNGFTFPDSIGPELTKEAGPFNTDLGWRGIARRWTDDETFFEEIEYQNGMFARWASYLLTKYEWDLFFMQAHCLDSVQHMYLYKADPISHSEEQEENFHFLLRAYKSIDAMIGNIVNMIDENALLVVVSDHGSTAGGIHVPFGDPHGTVGGILEDAGLTVYKTDPKTGRRVIDWSKTRAVFQRAGYIYVNLKGRDPYGIVESNEYENVRDKIIGILYNYTDPKTGKKPITLALRREDARIMGLHGERVGDIIYAFGPEFGGTHGQQLPTATYGIGSMASLFIMAGPGVKKNYVLERTMNLVDIVPTICYLMNLPIPNEAEGAILYQALKDRDMKLKIK